MGLPCRGKLVPRSKLEVVFLHLFYVGVAACVVGSVKWLLLTPSTVHTAAVTAAHVALRCRRRIDGLREMYVAYIGTYSYVVAQSQTQSTVDEWL